ncbi:Fc.00g098210.m01.CDS01 [Cosmosporella sp. VM-42]
MPSMFYNLCRDSTLGRQLEEIGLGVGFKDEEGIAKSFMRMKRLLSWQPFVTEKGYIGLARDGSSAGDEIWIIAGSSVPIVLSPSVGDQRKKEVCGECFLDGFMFGEIATCQG